MNCLRWNTIVDLNVRYFKARELLRAPLLNLGNASRQPCVPRQDSSRACSPNGSQWNCANVAHVIENIKVLSALQPNSIVFALTLSIESYMFRIPRYTERTRYSFVPSMLSFVALNIASGRHVELATLSKQFSLATRDQDPLLSAVCTWREFRFYRAVASAYLYISSQVAYNLTVSVNSS